MRITKNSSENCTRIKVTEESIAIKTEPGLKYLHTKSHIVPNSGSSKEIVSDLLLFV